jgi:hypothetical protein
MLYPLLYQTIVFLSLLTVVRVHHVVYFCCYPRHLLELPFLTFCDGFIFCWCRRGGQSAQLAQELNLSLQDLVVI